VARNTIRWPAGCSNLPVQHVAAGAGGDSATWVAAHTLKQGGQLLIRWYSAPQMACSVQQSSGLAGAAGGDSANWVAAHNLKQAGQLLGQVVLSTIDGLQCVANRWFTNR
jgi:hypothetical protein